MISTHTPTRFQTARYSVIHALSKGADAEEVVQYIRNYEMEDSFKIGLVAEVLFFIKATNNGMKLEWAPDLGTNIDFCALHIHSRSKIDVTTNLAYKKTMLMSGYIALSQGIYFAEVRFAKDAFIGLSRAKVLLTESVDKMLASIEILWLGSHELYSLNVYNQLVWEVSPDIAQRLIRKKMKRYLETIYHPDIRDGLVSLRAIQEVLLECSSAVYSHIKGNGKRRCFTEIDIHEFLEDIFAVDWDDGKEWGLFSKLWETEAHLRLLAHICSQQSSTRRDRSTSGEIAKP